MDATPGGVARIPEATAPHPSAIMTPPRTEARNERSGWLQPRSPAAAALVFAVGYAVVQPLGQLLIHAVRGLPLPFSTAGEWRDFVLVCAGMGAAAGAAWYAGDRLPAGSWKHAWVRSTVTMVAFSMLLSADTFAGPGLVWWIAGVLLVAVFMGTLLTPLQRWSDAHERSRAPAGDTAPGASDAFR
jgi:hypothetical protein